MRSRTTATAAAVLMIAGFATAGTAQAQPEPTPSPAPAQPATTIAADGTYQVGTDIAPGTYTSAGPANDVACYWKRTSDGSLVDNAMTKQPQTVRIEATDTSFTTSHCQTWEMAACGTNCPPPPAPAAGPAVRELIGFLGPRALTPPPTGRPPSQEPAGAN